MLGFEKKAKQRQVVEELKIAQCPICEAVVTQQYFMEDKDTKKQSRWLACSCGIVWQMEECKETYDITYKMRYAEGGKKYEEAARYPVKVYAPLIEEAMYGRRVLQVGVESPYQLDELASRGWVTQGIDKNPCLATSEKFIAADFETHDFEDSKYNLIWLYSTLECFRHPDKALKKCFDLLPEDGMIFIATPDTDFINTRSSSAFPHWKPTMNRLMWNRRSLKSYLEKLGFNVILCRRNYEHRFPQVDDVHLICQRNFF